MEVQKPIEAYGYWYITVGIAMKQPYLGSKLPLFFPYNRGWENHQPFIGPHYKDSVIKGGRSPIPNIATFDHGTFQVYT